MLWAVYIHKKGHQQNDYPLGVCRAQDQDTSTVGAVKVRASLNRKATIDRGTPGQLLSVSMVGATVEVRAALGKADSLKRIHDPSGEPSLSWRPRHR